MRLKLYGSAALLLVLVLAATPPAIAVTCHCFRDRTFEVGTPASADPYILATTRNSLAAAATGIEKGTVVKQRMKGATENDLWLYGYLPRQLGVDPANLRDIRSQAASWEKAMATLNVDASGLGAGFKSAVTTNDDDEIATTLADGVLARAFKVDHDVLGQLHRAGANIAETTLSVFISDRSKHSPPDIFQNVKSGQETWGSFLYSMDIQLDKLGEMVMDKVRASE